MVGISTQVEGKTYGAENKRYSYTFQNRRYLATDRGFHVDFTVRAERYDQQVGTTGPGSISIECQSQQSFSFGNPDSNAGFILRSSG
jgi:hypothetical protein